MPKPPTAARGRRVAVTPPPPEIRRRFAFGPREPRRRVPAVDYDETSPSVLANFDVRNIVVLVASVAGIGVAMYLTLAHFSAGIQLTCPATGPINCEAVTHSPESYVFGIPVALLGLIYFVAMTGISLPVVWRSKVRVVAQARLAMAVAGIGFVCYLVYAELFEIDKICLWCTGVHVLTLIIFATITTGWRQMSTYATEPVRR